MDLDRLLQHITHGEQGSVRDFSLALRGLVGRSMDPAENLADVPDKKAARDNLGLGALAERSTVTADLLDPADLGNVNARLGTFSTVADVENSHIPPVLNSIRTNGYNTPGDGGGALYKRVESEPSHAGKIQSADGSWWELDAHVVNVKYFGAKLDGSTNDTSAVQSALSYGGEIFFPEGVAVIDDSLIMPVSPQVRRIFGESGGRSLILWKGDNTVRDLFDFSPLFNSNEYYDSIRIENLTFEGSHKDERENVASYPLKINRVRNVVIKNVEVRYSKTMGIAVRGATSATVSGCYVHHCARDGINVANCVNTSVVDNVVEFVDDDAIAAHNQSYQICRQCVIVGNRVRFGQGIKVLGAQALTVTGNTLDFVWGVGISVANISGGLEGNNATNGVTITGNSISNPFGRELLDGLNNLCPFISLNGVSANAGTLDWVPGTHGIPPYDYFYNMSDPNADASQTPIPASGRIVISGNSFVKDMPTSGMLSDVGVGLPYLRDGEYDISLDEEGPGGGPLRQDVVRLSGGILQDVIFANNVVHGVDTVVSATAGTDITRFLISGNIIKDVRKAVFLVSGSAVRVHAKIIGNVIDCDPYWLSDNRLAAGGWSSLGGPTVFNTFDNPGCHLEVSDNDIYNSCRISDVEEVNAQDSGRITFRNNRLFGEFNTHGFSSDNKGIGRVPGYSNGEFIFVTVNMDKTDEDYGKILHVPVRSASAVPSSAYYYPQGWYVTNRSVKREDGGTEPYVVMGWVNVSPGTGNWEEVRSHYELG